MDFIDIIRQRKSIRHFKTEMPPREIILECLEAASWAPNPTSQQPWKFIVLTGTTLKTVCSVIEERFAEASAAMAAQPAPPLSPDIEEILKKRKQQTMSAMLSFLEDKDVDMQAVGSGNFNFHGAPVGILFAVYPSKNHNYFKATVAAMENFMLAAAARGLGTCWMNAVSICQDHIKEALGLAPDLILVDGTAMGFPAMDSPLNQIPRSRLPIEQVTEWLG